MLWKTTLIHSLYVFAAAAGVSAQSDVKPAAIYDGGLTPSDGHPILLRIGNGGAGQSGLVKVLADQFIIDRVDNGTDPFRVAWYRSDTTVTINYLAAAIVDVGITYSLAAERLAQENGIAKKPSYYAFRDHFYFVGPKSNPAGITTDLDIEAQFSKLYTEAEKGNSTPPVRFLTRYDKSATNIKESLLFVSIGQVPWATAVSTWYHQYIAFPIQALTAAIELEEYTLTDRGTFLSLNKTQTDQAIILKQGGDTDPNDKLLNPAHLLVGTKAKDAKMAQEFADWVIGPSGQKVIGDFEKNGQKLYTPAPPKGN